MDQSLQDEHSSLVCIVNGPSGRKKHPQERTLFIQLQWQEKHATSTAKEYKRSAKTLERHRIYLDGPQAVHQTNGPYLVGNADPAHTISALRRLQNSTKKSHFMMKRTTVRPTFGEECTGALKAS